MCCPMAANPCQNFPAPEGRENAPPDKPGAVAERYQRPGKPIEAHWPGGCAGAWPAVGYAQRMAAPRAFGKPVLASAAGQGPSA